MKSRKTMRDKKEEIEESKDQKNRWKEKRLFGKTSEKARTRKELRSKRKGRRVAERQSSEIYWEELKSCRRRLWRQSCRRSCWCVCEQPGSSSLRSLLRVGDTAGVFDLKKITPSERDSLRLTLRTDKDFD